MCASKNMKMDNYFNLKIKKIMNNVDNNFKTIANFSNYLINMDGKVYNQVNNKFIKANNGLVYIFDDYVFLIQ